jgi:hypothetical protein
MSLKLNFVIINLINLWLFCSLIIRLARQNNFLPAAMGNLIFSIKKNLPNLSLGQKKIFQMLGMGLKQLGCLRPFKKNK